MCKVFSGIAGKTAEVQKKHWFSKKARSLNIGFREWFRVALDKGASEAHSLVKKQVSTDNAGERHIADAKGDTLYAAPAKIAQKAKPWKSLWSDDALREGAIVIVVRAFRRKVAELAEASSLITGLAAKARCLKKLAKGYGDKRAKRGDLWGAGEVANMQDEIVEKF